MFREQEHLPRIILIDLSRKLLTLYQPFYQDRQKENTKLIPYEDKWFTFDNIYNYFKTSNVSDVVLNYVNLLSLIHSCSNPYLTLHRRRKPRLRKDEWMNEWTDEWIVKHNRVISQNISELQSQISSGFWWGKGKDEIWEEEIILMLLLVYQQSGAETE